MADFLTRLAERSQGWATVVRPLTLPWTGSLSGNDVGFGADSEALLSTASVESGLTPKPDRQSAQADVSRGVPRLVRDDESRETERPRAGEEGFSHHDAQRLSDSPPPPDLPAVASDPTPSSEIMPQRVSPSDSNEIVMLPSTIVNRSLRGASDVREESASGRADTEETTAAADGSAPASNQAVVAPTTASVPAGGNVASVEVTIAQTRSISTSTRPISDSADPPVDRLLQPPAMELAGAERPQVLPVSAARPRLELPPAIVPDSSRSNPTEHAAPISGAERATPAESGESALGVTRNELPPSVKVTIGRVEIRAAAPDPPVAARQAPRPRQPAMSLSDYLKRRSGGGRE